MELDSALRISHEHTTKYWHNTATVGEWLAQSPNTVYMYSLGQSSKTYSSRYRSI